MRGGVMNIISLKCPNCGSPIKPTQYRCEFCRSYIIMSNDKFVDLSNQEYDLNQNMDDKNDNYPGIYVFGRLLGEGERPIALGLANYFTGDTSAGGKLLLTNKSISFSAHALNVGRLEAKIELDEIVDVYLYKNYFISQQIIIDTNDSSHKFVVYHGQTWVDKIKYEVDKHKRKLNNHISSDYTEELRKLKKLLEDGIITQEEFDIKKRMILKI